MHNFGPFLWLNLYLFEAEMNLRYPLRQIIWFKFALIETTNIVSCQRFGLMTFCKTFCLNLTYLLRLFKFDHLINKTIILHLLELNSNMTRATLFSNVVVTLCPNISMMKWNKQISNALMPVSAMHIRDGCRFFIMLINSVTKTTGGY